MLHSDRASGLGRWSSTRCLFFAGTLTLSACVGSITGGSADDSDDSPGDDQGDDGGGGGGGGGDGVGGGEGLNPDVPSEGSVRVTLHPGPQAVIGSATVVSFGAPFPRGALTDAGQLRARLPGGDELPINAQATLPWRVFPGRSDVTESVRAAMVSVEVTFPSTDALDIDLEYGAAPTASLAAVADPRADWIAVTDGEYPNGSVSEPPVYATFPPDWLGDCVLRTRTVPVGADPTYDWLDESVVGFAYTAVNDVPDAVDPGNLIDYVGDSSAWLFDRTSTLYGVYVRTGDVQWLRHAHRSAQFYLGLVDQNGYFTLKGDDLKYSYGRSLLIDYIFTGDPALLDAIERIAGAGEQWDPTYDIDANFWTERHQTYALLAALSAWEATGDAALAQRTREVAQTSFDLAREPAVASWPDDGCMLHTMNAHEGAGGDVPVCSPWMSALFTDAVWEYYVHTADTAALDFLISMGHFVANVGLYQEDGHTVPWYLVSSETTFTEGDDIEHVCDVGGLVARGAWAEMSRGGDPAELRAVAGELVSECQYNLDSWHRPDAVSSGLTEWRLTPERKFNWWFGTTSDLGWLLAEIDAR
ncbi:MAG TPA: hypothetical protein VKB80_32625 [Kofleriaceae bacterium]|nr:hypothetical protein [Kofleriaceae bacterium]